MKIYSESEFKNQKTENAPPTKKQGEMKKRADWPQKRNGGKRQNYIKNDE